MEMNATRPPIAEAFDRLNASIGDLDDSIARLINQILPVLGPDVNPEKDFGESPAAAMSDVANVIHNQADKLLRINNIVNAVIHRVEL
jgi:hypothetical protein